MSTTFAHSYPVVDLLRYTSSSKEDPVSEIVREASKHFEFPATRQKRKETIDAVMDAYLRSHQAGMSETATPISEFTYKETIDFLRRLPSSLPSPEVVVEPDGDLGLEWYVSNYWSFVVGFSGKGIVSYSGLFGRGRKTYGTEFVSESIPRAIVENIRRVFA